MGRSARGRRRGRPGREGGGLVHALAGAGAGLLGTALARPLQRLLGRLQSEESRRWEARMTRGPAAVVGVRRAADSLGVPLSFVGEVRVGKAVEWGHGALWGAGWGFLLASRGGGGVAGLSGLLLGAARWLLTDGLLVSLLGLAPPPEAFPLSTHGKVLASHLAWGVATDAGLRGVRAAL